MGKIEVLKLPPYYYPEQISSSHLTEDLNDAFRVAGFHTTVYCPTPCRGIDESTRNKYKLLRHEQLEEGSIDLYRFPLYKEGKNPIKRAIRYLICNLIQYRKGIKTKGVDVVFAGSTPPTQGILCGRVAKKLSKKYGYKVPFIYSLQDVFPDSLVNAGITKKGSIIWRIGRIMEDHTYRYADRIIVISEDIRNNILNKGVPENKISIIPNWIDVTKVNPVSRENNSLFDELGIDRNKFIVTYAGNLGTAQGIETVFKAAELLQAQKDILFIIFGGGINKNTYVEQAKSIDNIRVYDLYPPERVSEVYSLGDASIVSCKKGVGYGAVPSKSLTIMATGTPIVLSFDKNTALWNLVQKTDCGYVSEAENSKELARVIMEAYLNREEARQKGLNGRKTVVDGYSKQSSTNRYVRLFEYVLELTQE